MARRTSQTRRAPTGSRPKTHSSAGGAGGPRGASTGAGGARGAGGAGRKTQPGLLQNAGSTVGTVLQKSTEVVREAGAGLVNTAREMITSVVAGQHDALSVLKSQHRHVEALFKRALSSEDPRARKQLMKEIADALAMHTAIEEEIFYPAVRSLGTEPLERLIDEAFEEHHVVDLVLAELPRVSPRDDRFVAKMTVLSEVVDHHVQEEEDDMFKRAQQLGKDRLQQLGARLEMAAARRQGAPRTSTEHE